MTTTEEILNETFKKVGNDFGIDTSAEFAAYRDFKIGGTIMVSEIGKKQRLIYEAFGIDPPVL